MNLPMDSSAEARALRMLETEAVALGEIGFDEWQTKAAIRAMLTFAQESPTLQAEAMREAAAKVAQRYVCDTCGALAGDEACCENPAWDVPYESLVAAIRALPLPAAMDAGRQPIETHDGSNEPVLVGRDNVPLPNTNGAFKPAFVCEARFDQVAGWVFGTWGHEVPVDREHPPTHWQPIPTPPNERKAR